jgi:hypothetical protein
MNYWKSLYSKMKNSKIDTWDYQLLFSIWNKSGICIIPNVNLVSNIGFGKDATHTNEAQNSFSNIQTNAIYPLVHAKDIEIDRGADERYFKRKVETPFFTKTNLLNILRKIHVTLTN